MNASNALRLISALLFSVSVIPAAVHAQDAAPGSEEPVELTLSEDVLSQYVGAYQMAPNVNMTMTLENGGLFTQLPGQPKFAVFPESETRFALQAVPAAIEFEKDASGAVIAAVLHQNGRTLRAPRVNAAP